MAQSMIKYQVFIKEFSGIYQGLVNVSKTIKEKDEDKHITELVKIRASQLNGCTFCLKLHIDIGLQLGLTQTQINAIAAWRDSDEFTEKQKTAIALAESLTNIIPNKINDDLLALTKQYFSDEQLILLTCSIAGINAWNRIGIGLGF